MVNPYNQKTQEAKYLSWDHGFNAATENENPYEQDVDPEYYHAWNQGFRANKNRVKKDVKPTPELTPTPVANVVTMPNSDPPRGNVDLSSISTDVLLHEVALRIKKFETTVADMKKVLS
jgi:hypothetical protein